MILKYTVPYPAYAGKEDRTTYVYLPQSYRGNQGKHYPVLYAFDGHNLFYDTDATFGKSWGLGKYLDENHVDLIVASVECNHSPDGGRLMEYSPYDFIDYEEEEKEYPGLGEQTMDYYISTLKTFVDHRFRTIPDREHTFIMGSSMGGLMSLYAVTAHNDVFSRAAALSPTLWANPKALRKSIENAFIRDNTVVYMDYGAEEFYGPNTPENFHKMVQLLLSRGILLTSRLIPNGTHTEENWQRQLPFAIQTLMYEIPDETFHRCRRRRYGHRLVE